MKSQTLFRCFTAVLAGFFPCQVLSFPTVENMAKYMKRESLTAEQLRDQILAVQSRSLGLDPSKPVDVSGNHKFVPPGPGDQRGPCVGLNALANHGYLSHDGVASLTDIITVPNKVFGLSTQISTLLALMAVLWTGNPLSGTFSVGGPTPKVTSPLGGLLGLFGGQPRGLDYSHNWIESDGSFTRDDLYVTNDCWTMNMTVWESIYYRIPEDGVLTMEDFGDIFAERLEHAIQTNPYLYEGPLTGIVIRNAGLAIPARLISNHTDAHPNGGAMTREVFKSFWGVTDENGALKYNPGHERIPENFYRMKGEYDLIQMNLDIVSWIAVHPRLGSIGGNTGKVNSYAGVDLSNITGGVLNAANFLEGNNLLCFALEIVKVFIPHYLSGLLTLLEAPLKLLEDTILGALLSVDCPVWRDMTIDGKNLMDGLEARYPGAKKAKAAL